MTTTNNATKTSVSPKLMRDLTDPVRDIIVHVFTGHPYETAELVNPTVVPGKDGPLLVGTWLGKSFEAPIDDVTSIALYEPRSRAVVARWFREDWGELVRFRPE